MVDENVQGDEEGGSSTGRVILLVGGIGCGLYLLRFGVTPISHAWGMLLIGCTFLTSAVIDAGRGVVMFGYGFVKRSDDSLLYWIASATNLAVGLVALIWGGSSLLGYTNL